MIASQTSWGETVEGSSGGNTLFAVPLCGTSVPVVTGSVIGWALMSPAQRAGQFNLNSSRGQTDRLHSRSVCQPYGKRSQKAFSLASESFSSASMARDERSGEQQQERNDEGEDAQSFRHGEAEDEAAELAISS